jgi:hypothetical protein
MKPPLVASVAFDADCGHGCDSGNCMNFLRGWTLFELQKRVDQLEEAGKSSNNAVNMMPNHAPNQNSTDESIRILFSREETCGKSTFEAILALLRQRICGPALKPSA